MGRPPSNGGPTFRFTPVEVGEMEAILQAHNYSVPGREILEALAQRFSSAAERSGKMEVSMKQVWNWFQNRRYALRAKAAKTSVPGQATAQDDQAVAKNVYQTPQPQAPKPQSATSSKSVTTTSMPQVPHSVPAPSATQSAGKNTSEISQMEFEAKSARDGAWYDVASFLSHRSLEKGDPEVLVRFAGFGPEEDEWVNVRKHVRQRSLPCESLECVAVLPGDLILCFQEGKEQALYYDAHVLDAQRRRHDVRGCRCRFLVRYDHDQSEEIVPLRKICRRPETDFRMLKLQEESVNPQKTGADPHVGNNTPKITTTGAATQKQPKPEEHVNSGAMATSAASNNFSESKLPVSKSAETGNTTAVENSNSSPAAATNTTTIDSNPTLRQQ